MEIALVLFFFFADIYIFLRHTDKNAVFEQNPAYKSYMSHTANYSRILFSVTAILQHPERQQSGELERLFFLIPNRLLLFILKILPRFHPCSVASPTKGIK